MAEDWREYTVTSINDPMPKTRPFDFGAKPMSDHMREAMSDQIGPRLDAIERHLAEIGLQASVDTGMIKALEALLAQMLLRLDALEGRCQQIEIRLRDMDKNFPIPVAEYLPRGL